MNSLGSSRHFLAVISTLAIIALTAFSFSVRQPSPTVCLHESGNSTLAIVLIVPDVLSASDVEHDGAAALNAHLCWTRAWNCSFENDRVRWHVGREVWMAQPKHPRAHVYFVKYSAFVQEGAILESYLSPYVTELVVGVMPKAWSSHASHITYKSAKAFEYLARRQYTYVVRGHVNVYISVPRLFRYLDTEAPAEKLYTSPFWQGGYYAYGYFVLMSADVADWIAHQAARGLLIAAALATKTHANITGPPREGAELAALATGYVGDQLLLQQFAYSSAHQIMTGGDSPLYPLQQKYSLQNRFALRLDNVNGDRGKELTTKEALVLLKAVGDDCFLYRLGNDTVDHGLAVVYRQLLQVQ